MVLLHILSSYSARMLCCILLWKSQTVHLEFSQVLPRSFQALAGSNPPNSGVSISLIQPVCFWILQSHLAAAKTTKSKSTVSELLRCTCLSQSELRYSWIQWEPCARLQSNPAELLTQSSQGLSGRPWRGWTEFPLLKKHPRSGKPSRWETAKQKASWIIL